MIICLCYQLKITLIAEFVCLPQKFPQGRQSPKCIGYNIYNIILYPMHIMHIMHDINNNLETIIHRI